MKKNKTNPVITTTIGHFLTDKEIDNCIELYKTAQPGTFAKLCEKQIILPVLPRIEEAIGQKMHSRYVAYLVEWALTVSR